MQSAVAGASSKETAVARRRKAYQETARHLQACIAVEAAAERDVAEIQRVIALETASASDPSGSDRAVEAFARWLPGARQNLDEARRRLESLQAETARTRASLAACRAALARVEAAGSEPDAT